MTDLGNKVMESMFDAWCDDECKPEDLQILKERAEAIVEGRTDK